MARTISAHALPLRYCAAYCHDIRNQRRILSNGETGRSSSWRRSSGRSSTDWLSATRIETRRPGSE
eukprot:6257395-Prymnesium_polylepis.1